ncbi:hypothetical protein POUND7_010052 [Theobroma cacao]
MEGTIFPNKPVYPVPTKRQTQSNKPLQFSSSTLPLPPQSQSPPSLPLDSLLQHLLHLSSPPNTIHKPKTINPPKTNNSHFPSLHISSDSTQKLQQQVHPKKPTSASLLQFDNSKEESQSRDGSLEFLSRKGMLMLNSIKEQPLNSLNDFFNSVKFELLQFDMFSLLKALDLSGDWERALLLFQWVVSDIGSDNFKLDNQVVELMVRVLGRESQHGIALKLFDLIPIEECSLDVRAHTTILHAYSRTGKYKRAISMFEKMKATGLSPTLVTYNVMLDVYGKMGRSWNKILQILDEMRSKGLEFDEFTCSTVISACGREGLLNEAKEFFTGLKSQGYVPGTVTYNSLLQGMHKFVNQVFREMKSCGFEPDRDTFNTLISAYGRCGSEIDATKMYKEMIRVGFTPCVTTYNALLNALARRGDWKAAESVILDMKNKGFRPSETSYSLMLQCYAKGGNVKGIEKIEKDIYDGHIYPSWMLLRTLVLANFRCRALKGMERAFQELRKNGYKPDLVLFNSMLSIFSKNNMYDRAHEMLHLIRESGLTPDLVTYNSLMDMYARAGECWRAEEILIGLRKSEAMDFVSKIKEIDDSFDEQSIDRLAFRVRENLDS